LRPVVKTSRRLAVVVLKLCVTLTKVIATEVNPDELAHDALAGELINHLIAGVVLTPGIAGTLSELQRRGFNYANSG
jgi:hypothetical protein